MLPILWSNCLFQLSQFSNCSPKSLSLEYSGAFQWQLLFKHYFPFHTSLLAFFSTRAILFSIFYSGLLVIYWSCQVPQIYWREPLVLQHKVLGSSRHEKVCHHWIGTFWHKSKIDFSWSLLDLLCKMFSGTNKSSEGLDGKERLHS